MDNNEKIRVSLEAYNKLCLMIAEIEQKLYGYNPDYELDEDDKERYTDQLRIMNEKLRRSEITFPNPENLGVDLGDVVTLFEKGYDDLIVYVSGEYDTEPGHDRCSLILDSPLVTKMLGRGIGAVITIEVKQDGFTRKNTFVITDIQKPLVDQKTKELVKK